MLIRDGFITKLVIVNILKNCLQILLCQYCMFFIHGRTHTHTYICIYNKWTISYINLHILCLQFAYSVQQGLRSINSISVNKLALDRLFWLYQRAGTKDQPPQKIKTRLQWESSLPKLDINSVTFCISFLPIKSAVLYHLGYAFILKNICIYNIILTPDGFYFISWQKWCTMILVHFTNSLPVSNHCTDV